jgi:hypothetical protein
MWQTPNLDHLVALTDDTGLIQHAGRDIPNRSTGYCTDDVARGFIVACGAARHEKLRVESLRLGRIYLAFLHDAQIADGRFHNFMSYDRRWLDEVGGDDAIGRAIWALGVGMRHAPRDGWRKLCATLFERALPAVEHLDHPRSWAYASLGIAEAHLATGRERPSFEHALRRVGERLSQAYENARADGWEWFEPTMTYDNARLPEALLRIGGALTDPTFVDLGFRTLDFYESVVIEDRMFVPIGNAGWYPRDGHRARYAQQPLEAAGMVDAALAGHAIRGEIRYRRLAELALEWYYGRNTRDAVMATGGGCFDGLDELGVNRNMGAESTLAYLSSALALAQPAAEVLRIAR